MSTPEYTRAVLANIRAAEVAGLLPPPPADALGDIFPFQPAVTFVPVDEPVLPEPARGGESPENCSTCTRPDSDYLWTSPNWRLRNLPGFGVHAFMLWPRAHLDLDELTPDLAAEQGRLLVAVSQAISAGIDGVQRVHLNRWGDGSAHLHWWFIARPAGLLQLRGSHLPTWLDVLPPLPADLVAAAAESVRRELVART